MDLQARIERCARELINLGLVWQGYIPARHWHEAGLVIDRYDLHEYIVEIHQEIARLLSHQSD